MKFRRKYYVRIGSTERRNKLGSTDFGICSNIRWILYVIHAPTEKRAEENPGDESQRWKSVIPYLQTSGFYGVIIDITDDDLIVEFGNNKNCRIPMQKAAIAQVEKASAE